LLTTAQVDLQLSRAAALLSGSLDLLAQRVWDGAAGDALARRSWIEPLLELSDVELAQLEEQGTEAQAMRALPQSLVMFGASAERYAQ
jgi:Mor family transcriptional regulator